MRDPMRKGLRRTAWLVAAIAGTALAVSAGYQSLETRRATARYPPPGRFLDVDEVRLHYIEQGSGSPVFLFHGNPGFVQDWAPAMPGMAKQHRVVAIDRPGHGYSERPSASGVTPATHAQLMHDAAQALGLGCPVIVGHSWGAGLALLYAQMYPRDVCGLVLVGPRAFRNATGSLLSGTLRAPVLGRALLFVMPPQLARHLVGTGLAAAYAPELPDRAHLEAAEALWARSSQVAAMVWDGENLNAALDQISAKYPQMTLPVTILVGAEDAQRQEAERLHGAIRHSRLVIMGGVGHELPRTHPGTVTVSLEDFRAR